jgi:protein-S-isoprenylcysteine O-methyltransferase Ste14
MRTRLPAKSSRTIGPAPQAFPSSYSLDSRISGNLRSIWMEFLGERNVIRHALSEIANDVLVACVLFISAGTVAWWQAWVLLGTIVSIHLIGNWSIARVSPALLVERTKFPIRRDQSSLDKLLLPACMAAYAIVIAIDGYDASHSVILGAPSTAVAAFGLIFTVLGWSLVMLTLRTNAYASTVIRHQAERGHRVIATGVYSVVRHPMYAGLIVAMVGMGLWLGTYAGAIATILPAALLAVRIVVEEGVLRSTLVDYGTYTKRVRYRLLPGVW